MTKELSNGAVCFFSVKEGVGDEVDESLIDESGKALPRKFYYYQEEEFSAVLENNTNDVSAYRFEIIQTGKLVKSPKTTWLMFFVRVMK